MLHCARLLAEGTMPKSLRTHMDYKKFYSKLFAPLEVQIGPIDPMTIFAIMGFDGGGPLNFSTIGARAKGPLVTYVSCELAVRKEQKQSEFGRFELICSCDNEEWVRRVLSDIGRMSLEVKLGHGHSVDIGPNVDSSAPLQGVLLLKQSKTTIDGKKFGVLRVIGITRDEMEFKLKLGTNRLVKALKAGGIYPHTMVSRASVFAKSRKPGKTSGRRIKKKANS